MEQLGVTPFPNLFGEPRSRKPVGFGLLVAFAGAAVLLLAAGCRQRAPGGPSLPPPSVTVAKPLQHEVMEWDEYPGNLEPVDFVDLRARVTGFIESAPFQEGSIVHRGQNLFEIDARPFQAELDSRLADQARAEAQVRIAEIEVNRLKRLIPQQAAAPFEYQTAEARLQQDQAALAAAKAAVETARLNVEWCHVNAPIAGRVSRKLVTPGNLITGGGGNATMLTTITSLDPMYCYFEVDEASVLKYQRLVRQRKRPSARAGQLPCFMQLGNETGFPHQGVIDFVDNRIDPSTGTIRVRGVFPNPQGWLEPGSFARVRLPGSGAYRALLVPDSAVVTSQNEKSLMVVGPDNVVQARSVEVGALFGELRAISQGIGPDDRVVIEGLLRAQPGVKVSPHETSITAGAAEMMLPMIPTSQESGASQPASSSAPAGAATSPAGSLGPLATRSGP